MGIIAVLLPCTYSWLSDAKISLEVWLNLNHETTRVSGARAA